MSDLSLGAFLLTILELRSASWNLETFFAICLQHNVFYFLRTHNLCWIQNFWRVFNLNMNCCRFSMTQSDNMSVLKALLTQIWCGELSVVNPVWRVLICMVFFPLIFTGFLVFRWVLSAVAKQCLLSDNSQGACTKCHCVKWSLITWEFSLCKIGKGRLHWAYSDE